MHSVALQEATMGDDADFAASIFESQHEVAWKRFVDATADDSGPHAGAGEDIGISRDVLGKIVKV